jgi:ABC-2 type transport system permease protein
MGKTSLIIKREYLTRVKKKSFIVMTILGPVVMAAFMAIIILLSKDQKENYKVLVVDDTMALLEEMPPMSEKLIWTHDNKNTYEQALKEFKSNVKYEQYDYLLWLPSNIIDTYNGLGKLVYRKTPSLEIEGKIKDAINLARESYILDKQSHGDSTFNSALKEAYNKARSLVTLTPLDITNIDEKGNKIDDKVDYKVGIGVGVGFSFITFFFIFFFGSQVMRGVIEEKTSRIVEVIISSVKPFQLMLGKIVGVGLVGLTQFIIWGVLGSILVTIVTYFFGMDSNEIAQMSVNELSKQSDFIEKQNEILSALFAVPWLNIISCFIFYFLGGYLIYSSLFAAIGAAVDNETDSQQFVTPIVAPLLLAFYVVMFSAFKNPDSEALYWLSMIPLTSPVAMLVRVSMGTAELWEVLVSMGLLIATFIFTTWIAGKVYRTGILMYGKKPSYKEIFKWIRHN